MVINLEKKLCYLYIKKKCFYVYMICVYMGLLVLLFLIEGKRVVVGYEDGFFKFWDLR